MNPTGATTLKNAPRNIWWPLAPVLLTAAVFAPVAGFDFVYDDRGQVVDTTQLTTWRNIPSFFTGHVWSWLMPASLSNYYRPGFKLWLFANFTLFERDAPGWHVATLAAHLLATFLVYRLALLLIGVPGIAAFAAGLFGVHPVHLGNVAPISGVADVLVTIFWILAIFCYRRGREPVTSAHARISRSSFLWNTAAVVLYAASVFTKEVGIVLPAILILHEWMFGFYAVSEVPGESSAGAGGGTLQSSGRRGPARIALGMVPFLVVAPVYLAVRVRVIYAITIVLTPVSLGRLLLTWPSMLIFYLKHLVWPLHLGLFYALPIVMRADFRQYTIPAAILVLIGAALWPAVRASRVVAFGLIWMALTLAPVFYLRGMVPGDFISDRYLYVPSIGFCIVAADVLRMLVRSVAVRAVVGGVVVALMATATFAQEFAWESNDSLFARAVEISPASATANRWQAAALFARGAIAEAAGYYRRAIELDPQDAQASYGLGLAYYSLGMLPEADPYFARAIRLEPQDAKAFLYLGLTRMREDRLDDAQILIAEAIRRKGRDSPPGCHAAMGEVLEKMGNRAAALAEYQTELKESPGNDYARRRIAALESESGR
jgi:protein O-mannosyl-transferase